MNIFHKTFCAAQNLCIISSLKTTFDPHNPGEMMTKSIKKLIVTAMLTLSMFAHAGVGLSAKAVVNMAKGDFLAAAIGGGLGAASLVGGINRIQNGRVGWGVFFTVLAEKDLITETDSELLSNADVATQEAFISIITDEELGEMEKAELLAELELGE